MPKVMSYYRLGTIAGNTDVVMKSGQAGSTGF